MAYPGPVNPDQYNYQTQVVFGGLNHRRTAGEYSHRLANQSYRMDWYEAVNLTADYYPVLASRPPHCFLDEIEDFNGMIGGDDVYVAAGTKLYRLDKTAEEDRLVEISGVTLTDTPKKMTMLGNRLIIFPDKVCVTYTIVEGHRLYTSMPLEAEETFENGENSVTASGTIFWSGGFDTPVIQIPESTDIFSDGDTVLISGCTTHAENNKTLDTHTVAVVHTGDPVVYGTNLYFPHNALTIGSDAVTIVTDSGLSTVTGHVESGPVTLTNLSKAPVKFFSGTYEGEAAAANCIQLPGHITSFAVGDAVKIAGCSNPKNNFEALVIREISYQTYSGANFTTLHFYENSFDIGDGEVYVVDDTGAMQEVDGYAESGTITFSRNVPDLDILFSHENRVWGAKEDTIWASALGKPEVWYNFDITGLESWTVDVLDEGDFTGGCSFLGYPIFFKDNHIYKVYGSIPSEFRVVGSADLGVEPGSGGSLAIAGEKLFYLSRAGVMCYTGALPQVISQPFGDIKLHNAVGGSDGLKYYISSTDEGTGETTGPTYIYDTQTGIWHTDWGRFLAFAWSGHGLYVLRSFDSGQGEVQARICFVGRPEDAPPGGEWEDVGFYAETFNLTEASPLRTWVGAPLEVRIEMDEDSDFYFEYKYGDGDWERLGPCYTTDAAKTANRGVTGPVSVVTPGTRSYILPQIPRRTDHYRIGLRGHGRIWIYSIAPKTEQGSSWHGINGGD